MLSLPFEPRQHGCRGSSYLQDGHELLALESQLLRVVVLLSKGADFLEFRYKPLDINVLWRSPQPLVPPGTALSSGFLDHYYGGWQVSLPSGAGASHYRGADFGVHGEAPLLSWSAEIVTDKPNQLSVRLRTRLIRTPFTLTRTLLLRDELPQLHITEVLHNTASVEMPYVWGHHPAFGPPLLTDETVCDRPAGTVRRLGRDTAAALQIRAGPTACGDGDFYWVEGMDAGWYALRNPRLEVGVCLAWDLATFPYLWNWRVTDAATAYPFWGRAELWALEPFSAPPSSIETTPPVVCACTASQ